MVLLFFVIMSLHAHSIIAVCPGISRLKRSTTSRA
jgi:hypothetical protein